jgi:hypothetical protein
MDIRIEQLNARKGWQRPVFQDKAKTTGAIEQLESRCADFENLYG